MYSLRYGTVPIVRRVGGLADTVVNATPAALGAGTATGITFETADSDALVSAVQRGLALYRDKKRWRRIQRTAMRQDFTWRHSAKQYLDLYQRAIKNKAP